MLDARCRFFVDAHSGTCWSDVQWNNLSVIMLGNEKQGISDELRKHTDRITHIPFRGKSESLNVSIAGGVLPTPGFLNLLTGCADIIILQLR